MTFQLAKKTTRNWYQKCHVYILPKITSIKVCVFYFTNLLNKFFLVAQLTVTFDTVINHRPAVTGPSIFSFNKKTWLVPQFGFWHRVQIWTINSVPFQGFSSPWALTTFFGLESPFFWMIIPCLLRNVAGQDWKIWGW